MADQNYEIEGIDNIVLDADHEFDGNSRKQLVEKISDLVNE